MKPIFVNIWILIRAIFLHFAFRVHGLFWPLTAFFISMFTYLRIGWSLRWLYEQYEYDYARKSIDELAGLAVKTRIVWVNLWFIVEMTRYSAIESAGNVARYLNGLITLWGAKSELAAGEVLRCQNESGTMGEYKARLFKLVMEKF